MASRGLIRVFDEDGKVLACIYMHWDGYPWGSMLEVAKFLASRKLVNGITRHDEINGMDDLAAQVVTLLKLKLFEALSIFLDHDELTSCAPDELAYKFILAGGVYLLPGDVEVADEEWVYHIKPEEEYKTALLSLDNARSKSCSVVIEAYKVTGNGLELEWKGTPKEYVEHFVQERLKNPYGQSSPLANFTDIRSSMIITKYGFGPGLREFKIKREDGKSSSGYHVIDFACQVSKRND